MQSFHRSRGRILFEVFCALAIAESCVGAWMQTRATAFLPAAVVAALYGIVRAFDMFGRRGAAVAVASQPTQSAPEPEPLPLPELELTAEESAEDGKPQAASPRASRARRAKSAPKVNRGRTKAREDRVAETALLEETKAVESAPPVETNVVESVAPEETNVESAPPVEPEVTEPAPSREAQVVKLTPPLDVQPPAPPADETPPVPLTPLFEPQPFVRQQRGMFGRKAG